MFDNRETQSQEASTQASSDDGKGYSKNTVKALSVIRRELQPAEDEEDEEKVMSFKQMANKVHSCLHIFFSLSLRSSSSSGYQASSRCILLRMPCPRYPRLYQTLSTALLRKHRNPGQGETLGTSTTWLTRPIHFCSGILSAWVRCSIGDGYP